MSKLPLLSHIQFISHSESQTIQLGCCLGKLIQPGHIIALTGDLGAGKTRWAQGIGEGLGVPTDEVINSPTFTFINQYSGRLTYYHADVYRLNEAIEADTLGLEDYFYQNGCCVIEWADRVQTILPLDRLEIKLTTIAETKRATKMQAFGEAHKQLLTQFVVAITPFLDYEIDNFSP